MTADAWVAVILAVVGLAAVYFLPREQRKPRIKVPVITLLEHKRKSWGGK